MKDMLGNKATIIPEENEVEVWVDLEELGYPRYSISNFGRIRGVKGEILRPNTDKNGYLYCCLYVYDENRQSKRNWVKIHRLVCEAFNGKSPKGKELVDHIDRCRNNNYYKNLRWADRYENAKNSKERTHCNVNTPIMMYDKKNQPIKRFENVDEIVDFFGVNRTQILANLAGQRIPFKFGYFRYIKNDEEKNLTN